MTTQIPTALDMMNQVTARITTKALYRQKNNLPVLQPVNLSPSSSDGLSKAAPESPTWLIHRKDNEWIEATSSMTLAVSHPYEDACPCCGFPADTPGMVRREDGRGVERCPTCYEAKTVHKRRALSRLRGELVEASFKKFTINQGNAAGYQAAMKFANEPCHWLTLWGDYGRGKSLLLGAIANSLAARQVSVAYCTLPEMLDTLRNGYSDLKETFYTLIERFMSVDVLLVDEVDKADLSKAWAQEKVVEMFEARYQERRYKGTAFGMNQRPSRRDFVLGDTLGWIFTRMESGKSSVVQVGGPDMRPVKG